MNEAAIFLEMAFALRHGWVGVAFGRDGRFTEKGRYEHADWIEAHYRWPGERDRLLQDVTQETATGRVDVYVCPALRGMAGRKKLDPHAQSSVVWADLDGVPVPDALVAAGAAIVQSGSDGHAHVYLPLAEPVDAVKVEFWNKALQDLVGADAKWSNESLLRLPGTLNHKADPPQPVTWRTPPDRRLSADEVDKLLFAFTPRIVTAATRDPADRLDLDRHPRVREALAEVYDDRSSGFHRAVAEMYRAGWTRQQMVAELAAWPQTPERFANRLFAEVERCLLKVVDEAQLRRRAADPSDLIAPRETNTSLPVETNTSLPAGRRVRLTAASSIRPLPVRWLWQDRIPVGEITLTPGRGGLGKSTWHAWLIAAVTRGTLPGSCQGTPRACIIAASEDSWQRTIVPRLIAAGADLELVYRVEVVVEGDEAISLTLPLDSDSLAAEIVRIGAAVLSVDPLMSTIAGTLDTHKDREVRHALEPLARLADKTGCAVLGNAHFNKSSGSDPLTLVTGSAAFGNVARAALGFARDPEAEDGSCVISQIKNNLGRLDLPSLRYGIQPATVDTDEGPAEVGRLVMLGETDRTVHDILRDRHDDDDRAERDEAGEWLQAYLVHSNGEAPAADVFKAGAVAGYSRDQLKRAKRRVGVDTRKTDMRGGWVWTLGPEWLAGSREGSTQGSEESRPQELHPSHPWCSLRRAIPSAARSADTSWRRSSERPG